MVHITSFEESFYYPPPFPGLEELVRFPDGEFKGGSIPNSTIWIFDAKRHIFRPEIHSGDIGCGMAGFVLEEVDVKEAANICYETLKKRNILGRGNHFVDICSPIESLFGFTPLPHHIMLLHTHGPDRTVPKTVREAAQKQQYAQQCRSTIGFDLAKRMGVKAELLGDWCHNSIEDAGVNVIYRKGVVHVEPGKLSVLPAHLGTKILVYTVNEKSMPPYDSMPHATGRAGPRGVMKVTEEEAASVRDLVYIPEGIDNASLRSEHPTCYNGFEKIFKAFGEGKYIVPVGEMRILAYVGKV